MNVSPATKAAAISDYLAGKVGKSFNHRQHKYNKGYYYTISSKIATKQF